MCAEASVTQSTCAAANVSPGGVIGPAAVAGDSSTRANTVDDELSVVLIEVLATTENGADGVLRAVLSVPTALTVATYVPEGSDSSVAATLAEYSPLTSGGLPRLCVAAARDVAGSAVDGKTSKTYDVIIASSGDGEKTAFAVEDELAATDTDTEADVPTLPAASLACATSVCEPAEAVAAFHVMLKGAVVSEPMAAPSTRNVTALTPMLSVAVAEIVTLPLTCAPVDGAVMATVGALVSDVVVAEVTLIVTGAEVVSASRLSRAVVVRT